MSREDVIKMLECIENHTFCEDANRSFDYCQEEDCIQCQIDFCKKNLKEGYTLMF